MSSASALAPIKVTVISDVACPFCWIGKRQLESAVREFGRPVDVEWSAFELNPAADPPANSDPIDYVGRLADKYGRSRDSAQQMIDRMVAMGKEVGVDMRFDRVRPTNTFDLHRLLVWAGKEVDLAKQNALKERLFEAYLTEGKLVSDFDVLEQCARDVGLDGERARAVLVGNEFSDTVRLEERQARMMRVSGVPCFVLEDKFAISGAQPAETILAALRRVDRERVVKASAEVQVEKEDNVASKSAASDVPVCGPDGCELPSKQ